MRFLCLAYYDEEKFDQLSRADLDAIMRDVAPHDAALSETGRVVLQASLGAPAASRSVRPKRSQPLVTDGPFIETKEQIGGLFIIEAKDIDEATEIASKHPAARLNEHLGWGVEVRPIDVCRALVEDGRS